MYELCVDPITCGPVVELLRGEKYEFFSKVCISCLDWTSCSTFVLVSQSLSGLSSHAQASSCHWKCASQVMISNIVWTGFSSIWILLFVNLFPSVAQINNCVWAAYNRFYTLTLRIFHVILCTKVVICSLTLALTDRVINCRGLGCWSWSLWNCTWVIWMSLFIEIAVVGFFLVCFWENLLVGKRECHPTLCQLGWPWLPLITISTKSK